MPAQVQDVVSLPCGQVQGGHEPVPALGSLFLPGHVQLLHLASRLPNELQWCLSGQYEVSGHMSAQAAVQKGAAKGDALTR